MKNLKKYALAAAIAVVAGFGIYISLHGKFGKNLDILIINVLA
ncbi:MAG: hypothetical protein ACI378_07065 [Bacteroides sp.]